MHVAIVTFDGFNELDSPIALGVVNRDVAPVGEKDDFVRRTMANVAPFLVEAAAGA